MQRQLQQVDHSTGEILDGVLVYVPKRQRIGGWMMAFQDSLEELAKAGLTGTQLRVLLFLMARLDWENFIAIGQKPIIEALRLKQPEVSKALKALKAAGILVEGPKVGALQTMRLNPHYGWKGRVSNLEKARRERLQVITGGQAEEKAE